VPWAEVFFFGTDCCSEGLEAAGNTSSAVDAREQKRPASGGSARGGRIFPLTLLHERASPATVRAEDNNIDTGLR
jgi:hypothetical protein